MVRDQFMLNVYLFLFAHVMHCKQLCVVTDVDAQAYSYVMLKIKYLPWGPGFVFVRFFG
jgi:hypothetical protein